MHTTGTNVRKFLDISIGHIDEETANDIRALPIAPILDTRDESIYEALVYVPSEETQPDDLPECIRNIFAYARGLGCAYVLISPDAPTVDILPFHEW